MNAIRWSAAVVAVWLSVIGMSPTAEAADSGPAAGLDVVAFSLAVITGDKAGEVVDITAERAAKPTLYCFIPQDKWSRPTARLLRTLDKEIGNVAAEGAIVAVWVTDDVGKIRDYLPNAQRSLQLAKTSLAVYQDDPSGPPEWGINVAVDLTIVAVKDGKVLKSFALISPNDTVAEEVLATLK